MLLPLSTNPSHPSNGDISDALGGGLHDILDLLRPFLHIGQTFTRRPHTLQGDELWDWAASWGLGSGGALTSIPVP